VNPYFILLVAFVLLVCSTLVMVGTVEAAPQWIARRVANPKSVILLQGITCVLGTMLFGVLCYSGLMYGVLAIVKH
jgi:hypothetical protein